MLSPCSSISSSTADPTAFCFAILCSWMARRPLLGTEQCSPLQPHPIACSSLQDENVAEEPLQAYRSSWTQLSQGHSSGCGHTARRSWRTSTRSLSSLNLSHWERLSQPVKISTVPRITDRRASHCFFFICLWWSLEAILLVSLFVGLGRV